MSGVNYTAAYYNDYTFPSWAEGVGWILAVLPIVMILLGAIFQIIRSGGHVSFYVCFYCYGRPLLQAWMLPDLNTIPDNRVRENSL